MGRRLRQWDELAPKTKEYVYLFNGPRLRDYDGVHITLPDKVKRWRWCWLKVWIDDKLAHTELIDWKIQSNTYYTIRQENVSSTANIKIIAEQL